MTSTVTKPAPRLAGKATYLELVANPDLSEDEQRSIAGWQFKGTKQVVVFPEYQDDTGKVHSPIVLTRLVSEYSPRAQWDWSRANKKVNPNELEPDESRGSYYSDYYSYPSYSKEEWDLLPELAKEKSKAFELDLILSNEMVSTTWVGEGDDRKLEAKQGWTVRDNKVISIEVTNNDFDELHTHQRTPQAVIRRINKVRDSLASFPTKLYTS